LTEALFVTAKQLIEILPIAAPDSRPKTLVKFVLCFLKLLGIRTLEELEVKQVQW
jgi:uncharacterized membrane protein